MWLKNFKIKYFLSHLIVSLLIACCCLILVFYVWHPVPLAKAIGVTHIFLMMLIIDVILGPLLTLLVAKQGKKTLKFDLSVIILRGIYPRLLYLDKNHQSQSLAAIGVCASGGTDCDRGVELARVP